MSQARPPRPASRPLRPRHRVVNGATAAHRPRPASPSRAPSRPAPIALPLLTAGLILAAALTAGCSSSPARADSRAKAPLRGPVPLSSADRSALAPLIVRERWIAADEARQDLAIAVVARLLGPDYRLLGTARPGPRGPRLATFQHLASGLELMLIPGERLAAGSLSGGAREVFVAPFLLGRFEVDQRTWDRFGGHDARTARGPELPIHGLSLLDAEVWLGKVGGDLRLPAAVEWRYAALAGSTRTFFWGDNLDGRYAWSADNSGGRPQPVTRHADAPNPLGLVDIFGNVAELAIDGRARARGEASRRAFLLGGSWKLTDRPGLTVTGGLTRNADAGLRVCRGLRLPADYVIATQRGG